MGPRGIERNESEKGSLGNKGNYGVTSSYVKAYSSFSPLQKLSFKSNFALFEASNLNLNLNLELILLL